MSELTLTVERDEDPMSPREWYNLGIMLCSHRRYALGDEQFDAGMYESWEDVRKELLELDEDDEVSVVLPLYLMDHSGISISVGDFNDPWDSGQVGFIYTTKEKVKEMGLSPDDTEELERQLRAEVEEYDKYLQGDVWSFLVKDDEGNVLESCGGFYSEEECRKEGERELHGLQETYDAEQLRRSRRDAERRLARPIVMTDDPVGWWYGAGKEHFGEEYTRRIGPFRTFEEAKEHARETVPEKNWPKIVFVQLQLWDCRTIADSGQRTADSGTTDEGDPSDF